MGGGVRVTDSLVPVLLLAVPLVAIWAFVVIDVLAQPDLGHARKAAWIALCTVVWPALALYLLVRPQQARIARPEQRSDPHAALVAAVLDHEAGRLGEAEFVARVGALRRQGTGS